MPLFVAKGVAADLQKISILQNASTNRAAGHISSAERFELHARTGDSDGCVLPEDVGILEKVDVGFLIAADSRERLVKNELLSGKRAGSDVKPTVLEGAFHPAHGDTGGRAK